MTRVAATSDPVRSAVFQAVGEGGRFDATTRLAMAHDASHYLLIPEAVVVANDVEQVARIMASCAEAQVPLTFRSGGTSLSGQAGSASVLIDTRRNFRGVEVLDGGLRVRVQPGSTVRQVNARLASYGHRLGPDPASEAACTIGGVVANNSSGMTCGIEANTYQTLESMVVVLPSGTTVDSSRPDASFALRDQEPALFEGLLRIRDRLRAERATVDTIRQQFSMKNTMGYGVNAFLDHDDPVEILVHLIIGSEGTLGFVASAVFRTTPIASCASTALLLFDDLECATAVLPDLVATSPAAVELLDTTSLLVSQTTRPGRERLGDIDVNDHAALLVEYRADIADGLAELTASAATTISGFRLAMPPEFSTDVIRQADLWQIRKGLYAIVAEARPSGTTALLEDIAVPVGELAGTCRELQSLFAKHDYRNSVIFGHAKDGNVHFMLTERFDDPDRLVAYSRFTDDMVDLVLGRGGTLKAEHGTGRIMAPFVERQYGPEIFSAMVEVKELCDPSGILNPGVVISGHDDAHLRDLKSTPTVEVEVDRCVECGFCEPVCPSRDLTLTPRQRIVLRREIAQAEADCDEQLASELASAYDYQGIETCAADGMCETVCPVGIDTGRLVKRLRAEGVTGRSERAWDVAARHWSLTTRGAAMALSAARALPPGLPSRLADVARRLLSEEVVPQWSRDLPRGGSRRLGASASDPVAVFVPTCLSSVFAPAEGNRGVTSAFMALCERAGFQIRVPNGIDDLCCGTPWKSKGMSRGYETIRERAADAIWTATDGGRLPVVCDATSCTEGLQSALVDPFRARGSEPRVVDAVSFAEEHLLDRLTVTAPIGLLVLHPTCSSMRLGLNEAVQRVARMIASRVVVPETWSCCGFAGDRGMLHPELTASATAAQVDEIVAFGADAHASLNRSCEIGMTRATSHAYAHLLELLEIATRRE